jgi:lysophospholipase L1-like esterase
MAQVITIAGERLFALKAQNNEQLDVDTFIFANVPGQDPNATIDRNEGLPPVGQIVHQQIVQQVGRVNDNVVIYSTVMDSLTGPFDFNWVGLYSSVNQTLIAVSHIPSVSKTITVPGAAGNTLNRNFGIEYSGIADLTGITVNPETWQLDFTARLSGMDELTRQLAADMNGKDWFIDDGFKVEPRSTTNTFKVTPGAGYVSGLRVELKQEHILTLQSYPQFVYVDAWFDGDASSKWAPKTAFTVTNGEMDDYIDVNGKPHYVFKLARITATDTIEDLRNVDGLKKQIESVSINLNEVKNRTVLKCSQFENRIKSGLIPSIFCYGDSTMWGAKVGNLGAQDDNNPPHSLGVALNLLFGVSVDVKNRAISGSTLRGMITGSDGSGSSFESKLSDGGEAENADIIYCNHGINDSQLNFNIDTYRFDLYSFVDLCRKNRKTPVLVTPNPNPILLIIDEEKSKRLLEYVRVIRTVAMQLEVDLVDQFYYFSKSTNQISINEIIQDGAHLSSGSYKQAGFNLAIPLISAGVLSKEGDTVGLNQTTWFDNGDENRQIQQKPDNNGTRCGATLSFDRHPTNLRGLNYPVILNEPQKCISAIGLQWPSGSKMAVSVNGYSIFYPFSLEKNYGDLNSLDWNAENKIRRQLFAGLNIIQFLFDLDNPSLQTGFAFSGLYLPPMRFSGMSNLASNLDQHSIGCYDSVLSQFNYTNTNKLELSDSSGSPVLSISKESGVFTAKLYQNSVVVYSQVINELVQEDGVYPTEIAIEPNQVRVNISNIALTIEIATPLPSLKISSPWTSFIIESNLKVM